MKVFRGLPHPLLRRPCAVAIGNFDGMHAGHRALVEATARAAADRGLLPAALTFEPHPRERLGGTPPARISTLGDKVEELLRAGAERVHLMNFSPALAALTPEAFANEVLVEGLDARWVAAGADFRFGRGREGDIEDLARLGRKLGFEVHASPIVAHYGRKVSSTRIREALSQGDLYEAGQLLGRRYSMCGRVIHGAALGRKLGYPTLNLAPIPPGSHAEPAIRGVFAVLVEGLGPAPLAGVASLGCKPTVASDRRWLLETHVFDWTGNAYGRRIRVYFIEKIRDEKKFSGLEELKAAIQCDALRARRILGLAVGAAREADTHEPTAASARS